MSLHIVAGQALGPGEQVPPSSHFLYPSPPGMACPLLPNGGWELQSGGSLFLLFLSHNLRSGPSPPVPSPLCAQTPGLPSSLPGSPGSWLAGQGQTQGGVLWRARVARLGAQAELWAGSQPQASPPALSFTWLLGKACAKPTITSCDRPSCKWPAGFSQGSGGGPGWVITLFLQSCWVQGCEGNLQGGRRPLPVLPANAVLASHEEHCRVVSEP